MAPITSLNKNGENASKTITLDCLIDSEKPMSEDDLIFYFYLTQYQKNRKPKVTNLSVEEELDEWIEKGPSDRKIRQRNDSSTKKEWKNCVFMYNFFRRKGCQERANTYLRKIENAKTDKMRARISKIRKLGVESVTLPTEMIDPEDAERRKMLEKNAKEESSANKLNEDDMMKDTTHEEQD